MRRLLVFVGLAVVGFPGMAQAAEVGSVAAWVAPFGVLASGLGMAFASGLCALGQGRAIAGAMEAMARQPSAAARIQVAMIIGLALIESLAIYTLVVVMILMFVQPITG